MNAQIMKGLAALAVFLGCGAGWKLRAENVPAPSAAPIQQSSPAPKIQRMERAPVVRAGLFDGLPSAVEAPLLERPLQPGDIAPEFVLPDQSGKVHHLSESLGKTVVLSFYPQDFTMSCVRAAVSLSDYKPAFEARGAVVYSVSVQPMRSKKQFANRFGIRHALLADDEKTVARKYGVLSRSGLAGRVTFLIGADGRILSTDQDVHAITHGRDVLASLDRLKAAPVKSSAMFSIRP